MSDTYDPEADVTVTLSAKEACRVLEQLACAAGYREGHHCNPDDALYAFVEAWIEATEWDISSDYGEWFGFIEMVDDLRWRFEHHPHSWRGDAVDASDAEEDDD